MITASLATIPGREHSLAQAVNSLLPQVDRVNVFLNGHNTKPVFENSEYICFEFGNNGWRDTAKFWWTDELDGHHLICDDDTLYPADFAERLTKAADMLQSAVGVMGRSYPPGKIKSYYKDAKEYYNQFRENRETRQVEILATCGTCFHTDVLNVSIDDYFETLNADIWFSAICDRQGVKKYVLQHEKSWLKYLLLNEKNTIFKTYRDNDQLQTKVFNEYFRSENANL